MSKLKRLLGALSLVALFIFSSCVDDSIAPEVTALRQAQVDLLNAEVAYQDAQTRYQNAQAESQEISNAFNSANNSITLQMNQATLDARLATLEVELATAANALAAQEALAIEAAADLARALATAGLADAAFYLDQWNAVVFGGFTADGHLVFGGTGLLATQALIVDQKAEVAKAELYLSADESVTQAFLDAKLDEALVEAQADLAAAEAALPVQKAVLAALEADDRLAAIAALQESLLPLADDSVAAIAAVEEAEAALSALENIDDEDLATVIAFQELDDATQPDGNFPAHRDSWRSSFARDSAAKANIVVFEGEIAAWEAYADSLQAIYDEFYPQFVEDYETTLASYEEDTVETWNNLPSNDAGADELYELEDAYSAYMIEWGLFNAKAVDSDGNPPSSADTTALVNKRVAYDGLNAAQMLNTPRDGQWFNQGTEDLEEYPGFDGNENDQNTWLNPPTALKGARSGGIGLGDGIGGALAAYITASGNDGTAEDAHDDAVRRWEAVDTYYGDIVDEYRGLQAYIDAVKAGTEDTGEYTGSVPQAPLSLTDFDGLQFMTQYFASIDGFNDDLAELLTELAKGNTTAEAIFNALFPGYYVCSCSEPAPPADPSVAKSIDDLEAEEATAEAAADDLEYALTIIDQDEIDAYLAALDALDQTDESLDAYYQSLVPARLAVDAAKDAQSAITDQQNDVRSQIMDIESACDGFIVNGDNYTECGSSITEQIEAVEATIAKLEGDESTAGSILNLTRGVLEAEIDIELAAQGQLKAEDMVAELQAELEALQTQEAVLQSMADEFQALLEAALAG